MQSRQQGHSGVFTGFKEKKEKEQKLDKRGKKGNCGAQRRAGFQRLKCALPTGTQPAGLASVCVCVCVCVCECVTVCM